MASGQPPGGRAHFTRDTFADRVTVVLVGCCSAFPRIGLQRAPRDNACRGGSYHSLGTTPIDDEPIADEICFVPVGGQVIFQLRTTGQVQLHQQYLFRFDQESMSFCADIWSDLVQWSDDHPEGSAAHGLEFARRGGGDSTELFITSRPNELLSYLEGRLSQAAQACDEADEEGHTEWMTYVRVTPPRQPDAADAADTSPSPPD